MVRCLQMNKYSTMVLESWAHTNQSTSLIHHSIWYLAIEKDIDIKIVTGNIKKTKA